MKVLCDVCSKEEATLYCSLDEAALCHGCDGSIHKANNLACKHYRVSLLPLSSSHSQPLCDICKEKRAFLFCQEDRAILCRDCDLPIHSANRHTGKHIRFLLTGVRLSLSSPAPEAAQPTTCSDKGNGGEIPSINGSTISEYLIKTIPGWHVEDLLQDSIDVASDVNGLSKQVQMVDDYLLPSVECDMEHNMSGFGVQQSLIHTWVPQVPLFDPQQMISNTPVVEIRSLKGWETPPSRKWRREVAAVPQINKPPAERLSAARHW